MIKEKNKRINFFQQKKIDGKIFKNSHSTKGEENLKRF